jgi:A/G-specific adenine glycosylase
VKPRRTNASARANPSPLARKDIGATIAPRLLRWYDHNGRKRLPWKRSGDPYHVWLSEVMLQQTQVATVIPYFERFIARFPTIAALARADVNSVLHMWTGLGYYARARNLHRAAQILCERHGGAIPRDFAAVEALPGIGRSTAGAILALAYGERHAILDGNVKRVLARYHAIDTPLRGAAIEQRLWALAERHTPRTRSADYTQAIMDLGATLCRRGEPECVRCPLARDCAGAASGDPAAYPRPASRKPLAVRAVRLLLLRDASGRVLLQRRPPSGIWGGLWSFPECAAPDVRAWCRRALGLDVTVEPTWAPLRHSFSHFHLDIHPIPARLVTTRRCAPKRQPSAPRRASVTAPVPVGAVMESAETVWYNCERPDERGLAAPVKRLLEQLEKS